MATKALVVRVILEQIDDEGDTPQKVFDKRFTLSGFTTCKPGERVRIATDAADQALAHSTPAMVMLASHDYPFDARLASGETLLTDLRLLLAIGHQSTTTMNDVLATASVLVTGNGEDAVDLEHWTVKQAT